MAGFGFSMGNTMGGAWGGFGGDTVETSTKVRKRKMSEEEVEE